MQGAEQMSENEHLLNVYVSKNAADSCADFMGFTMVDSPADVSDRRITPGKWLVRVDSSAACALPLFCASAPCADASCTL